MDDEAKQLLRELIHAQKEQTDLLRKHVLPLWARIRFSLLALLLLMTLMATGIGFTVLALRSGKASTSTPRNATVVRIAPNAGTLPVTPRDASLQVWPTPYVDLRTYDAQSGKTALQTSPDSAVQVWPTPRVNLRSYDGQVGKEVPALGSP
jgi:hypothetical protein